MPADAARRATEAASKQDFGGVSGGAKALAYGVARGATAGASDLVFRTLGAEPEHLRGFVEENPITSAIGEGVGAAVPAFAAPASLLGRTPAGKISGLGRSIVESAEGAGAAGRIGAATAGAAVEGGIYGGGQYLSQVALEDKPLSAEGFVAGVGHGALFGGVAGGGLAGIGSGLSGAGAALQRARSLFPQRIVTKEAAKAVEKEATTALSAAVTDGDAMVAAVRQRIALTDTKIGMAEAGEGTTRRLFGSADPQSVTDQVAGAVDRNRLTSAVQKYEASKAQLSDWIREEADPSLEAALTGITAPDVAPGLRRTGAAWPAEPPDITRALRGGALGTPAEVPADLINGVRADVTRALKRPAAVAVGTPAGGVSDDLLRGVREEVPRVSAPSASVHAPMDDSEYQEFKGSFQNAISPQQFEASMRYSKGSDADINFALRDGKTPQGDIAKLIGNLDESLNLPESRIPRDTELYRGLSGDWARNEFSKLKPGDTFADNGYTSTAQNADSKVRNEEVVFIISVPAGTRGAPLVGHYSSEREILLPRGSSFRVDSNEIVPSVPTGSRWQGAIDHVVHPDKSVSLSFSDGRGDMVAKPYREIHLSLVSDGVVPRTELAKRGAVTLESPLDKLSIRQIGEYQKLLREEMGKVPDGSAEYQSLSDKWDEAVSNRIPISDGKVPDRPEWTGSTPSGGADLEVGPRSGSYDAGAASADDLIEDAADAGALATGYAKDGNAQAAEQQIQKIRKIRERAAASGDEFAVSEVDFKIREAESTVKVALKNPSGPRDPGVPSGVEYAEQSNAFKRSITKDQMYAVENYSSHTDKILNAELRPNAGKLDLSKDLYTDIALDPSSKIKRHPDQTTDTSLGRELADLDGALAKSVLGRDIKVFRTISDPGGKIAGQLNSGQSFVDHGYVSTSANRAMIDGHYHGNPGDRVDLYITVPKGARAAPISRLSAFKGEHEWLLPRDSEFRVTSTKRDSSGRVIVEAEVVAKHGDSTPDASSVLGDAIGASADRQAAAGTIGVARSEPSIPSYDTLDSHLNAANLDFVEATVPASAIAERGWYELPGAHTDAVRTAGARKAIAEGQREAVKLNVAPSGKITVSDGRHRLMAAVEADAPIRVKWSTGFEPAPGDVLRHGTGRAKPSALEETAKSVLGGGGGGPDPKPAPGSLEDLLRGTKANIDAGGSLKGAGRDSPAWKAIDLGPQSGKYETSAMAAEERAARELTAAERAARPTTRLSAIDESVRRFREAKRVAQATGKPGSLDDLFAFRGHAAADMAAAGRGGTLDAVEAAPAHVAPPVDLGKTIVNREMRTQMRDINDDFKIDQILAKRPGKNVDVGPDLKRAAKVIGDFEDAGADLVEILGPEAPAVATSNAKAYKAALAAQADARAASAAKAGEHLAEKVGPELATATGGRVASALGALADIGTAIEVLHTMGVHVPDIDAIPVIGPVLSLFLKARAVMGIVGRKGGSIGKSIEGTIAAKHAAVRDRMAAATVSALDVGARGAKKLSAITAGPAVTLANRLFPGGPDPKSKDPRVLYAARMEELSRAMAPNAIAHAVSDRIQTADPHLQDAITSQVERGLRFLEGKAPKQTLLPGMLKGDGEWKPSKVALEKWGRYVHAVNDPASVLEDLAKGRVTIEGAETLRVVYPKLFAEAQRVLLEESAKLQRTLPYARRVMISIMYRVPVDNSMTPQHLQFLQPPAPAPMPGVQPMTGGAPQSGPAFTAPLNLGQQTMTSLDRRAGM